MLIGSLPFVIGPPLFHETYWAKLFLAFGMKLRIHLITVNYNDKHGCSVIA
jgi:hypothetical protein